MENVKKKLSLYRILKTVSYLIGFPLMAVMVFSTSLSFRGQSAFGSTAWYGLFLVLGVWLFATIIQIVMHLFLKNYKIRTMVMLAVAVALVLVSAIVIDAVGTKKINDVRDEYKEQAIKAEDYSYQVNWFVTVSDRGSMTSKLNSNINGFLNIYNIGYTSKDYGGENTDNSEYTYNKEDDAYYSPNGMFCDGYIFGIKQATKILITYHETQAAYKAENKDADEELDAALSELESDSSSDWNQYKQTEEYKAAYGENGSAYKYMLTEERLNLILSALGENLQPALSEIESLLGIMEMDQYLELLDYINKDISVDQIVGIVNSLNLFETPITKEALMVILKDFSFYQSPNAKPIFEFIEDEQLREYAYAKYYATEHGAKVGSVLIGDNIGNVTMDTSGYPASDGYSLKQLYQLQADLSYKPVLYPFMAARRYLYAFAFLVGLAYLLSYHFANKENELFATLTMGGK